MKRILGVLSFFVIIVSTLLMWVWISKHMPSDEYLSVAFVALGGMVSIAVMFFATFVLLESTDQ